jgi:hypothetical protein
MEEKTYGGLMLLLRLVKNGRQLYVEVLVGKGHDRKIEDLAREKSDNTEVQTLKKMDGFGNKDFVLFPENQAGGDSVIFPLVVKEDLPHLCSVTNMLVSLKREVERCLGKLGVGKISIELGNNAVTFRTKRQGIESEGGGHRECGPCDSEVDLVLGLNKGEVLEGNKDHWRRGYRVK